MPTTHGVVVIHGQGTAQYPGATLAQLLNSTIPSLEAGGYAVERAIDLKAQPPEATLTLGTPPAAAGDEPADRPPLAGDGIVFREAFWDDAFPPPSSDEVARWALVGLGQRAGGMLEGWFRDPSTEHRGFWHWRDLFARFQIGVLVVALGAGLLLSTVVQPLGWLLLTISKMPGLSAFGLTRTVAEAIRGLNPFLQHTLGDSVRLVTDRAWAATVRRRLEAPVLELLGRGDIEQVTIVAYSAGAAVAYDALLTDRPIPLRVRALHKRIRLVTLGSGINHLWNFAQMADNGIREREELASTPLDPRLIALAATGAEPHDAFWTDLYARFDYVPAGATEEPITKRSGLDRGTSFRCHRVINYDHLVDDHGGYFHNREQVIARLLPIILQRESWALPDPRLLPAVGARTDHDRRVSSVLWLTAAKLMPLYFLGAHALLYLADWFKWRAGTQVVGETLRGFPAIGGLSNELSERVVVDPRHAAVLLVIGVGSFVAARALYTWWRPKVDDEGLSWGHGGRRLKAILPRPVAAAQRAPTVVAILGLLGTLIAWALGATLLVVGPLIVSAVVAIGFGIWQWRVSGFNRKSPWEPRRWRVWSPILAFSLIVAVVAFIWIPARVEDGAFNVSLDAKNNNVEILWADAGNVLVAGGDSGKHGLIGLRWDDGRALLGPVITDSQGGALRCVLPDVGVPLVLPPAGAARVESEAYVATMDGDAADRPPAVRGVSLVEVTFPAPSGQRLAYQAGSDDDWVILVHGKGGTRDEGMRVVPALRALDLTVLSISYRNDPESILGERVQYDYGRSEWADLAAAVEYARGKDARRVVLYGYSMGGALIASYLERAAHRGDELPAAVVLDAPMLDLGATVERGIEPTPVLGWFAEPLTRASEWRLRRDFDSAAYVDSLVDVADDEGVPVLILHQRGDHIVPFGTSEQAAERSDSIALVEFAEPGHTRAWNDDPARYERRVTGFLSDELGTRHGALVSDQTTAVLETDCGDRTVREIIEQTSGMGATLVAR